MSLLNSFKHNVYVHYGYAFINRFHILLMVFFCLLLSLKLYFSILIITCSLVIYIIYKLGI